MSLGHALAFILVALIFGVVLGTYFSAKEDAAFKAAEQDVANELGKIQKKL